ncbi:MAG: hypothetical protein ACFFCZ_13040 [Promethearchaeota archaeon]
MRRFRQKKEIIFPDDLNNALNSLQMRLKDLKNQFEENNNNLKGKIDGLSNSLNEVASQVRTLEDTLVSLTRKITDCKADISNRITIIEELRSQVQTMNDEVGKREEEIAKEKATKEATLIQTDVLNQEISRLKKDLSQNEIELEEARKRLETLDPPHEEQKKQLLEKLENRKQAKERLLSKYKALKYLNAQEYLKKRVPEVQVLEVIQDQKTITMDMIAASTGRPTDFIEKIAQNLKRRKVIEIEDKTISLIKDFKLREG